MTPNVARSVAAGYSAKKGPDIRARPDSQATGTFADGFGSGAGRSQAVLAPGVRRPAKGPRRAGLGAFGEQDAFAVATKDPALPKPAEKFAPVGVDVVAREPGHWRAVLQENGFAVVVDVRDGGTVGIPEVGRHGCFFHLNIRPFRDDHNLRRADQSR
jgi:hypothetical protein